MHIYEFINTSSNISELAIRVSFAFWVNHTEPELHYDELSFITLQLGTVHLCRSVIRSIETARIFDFEEFPKRDKVGIDFDWADVIFFPVFFFFLPPFELCN